MSNYDFSLEEKSQKSKNKSKINNLNSECIDGFVEDENKHGLFEDLSPPIQIPPGNLFLLISSQIFEFSKLLINFFQNGVPMECLIE